MHPCSSRIKDISKEEINFRKKYPNGSGVNLEKLEQFANPLKFIDSKENRTCNFPQEEEEEEEPIPADLAPVVPIQPPSFALKKVIIKEIGSKTIPFPWTEKSSICKGKTIYIQIYGPEYKDTLREIRPWWRHIGASVPPIEDVNDSARRRGHSNPVPVIKTELRYSGDTSKDCAQMISDGMKNMFENSIENDDWKIRPIPAKFKATSENIELWIKPGDAFINTIQMHVKSANPPTQN